MQTLTLAAEFDQDNTFTVEVQGIRGPRTITASLHQGYQKADDGVFWAMKRSACLKDVYTAKDAEERARLAGPTVVSSGKSYDEGNTVKYAVRLPSGLDPKVAAKAIHDTIGGSNCRHDYDCCGCASRSVFTRLIRPRRLSVIVKTYYNY